MASIVNVSQHLHAQQIIFNKQRKLDFLHNKALRVSCVKSWCMKLTTSIGFSDKLMCDGPIPYLLLVVHFHTADIRGVHHHSTHAWPHESDN